jgi:hypothetical protein
MKARDEATGRGSHLPDADRFAIEQPESEAVLSPRPLRAAVGLPGKFRPANNLVPTASV